MTLSLCACSKESGTGVEEERYPLRFAVNGSSLGTKGAFADLDTLKLKGFSVYANAYDGISETPSPFMNAQAITYSTGEWIYSPVKYWPGAKNAKVDFYAAYTDGSSNVQTLYDWYNKPQTTFYVNDVVSKQTDMLWAPPVLGAKREVSDIVNFTFKHALTAFSFDIRLKNPAPAGVSVNVNSIKLMGYFSPKAQIIPDETTLTRAFKLLGDWGERSYTISTDGYKEVRPAVGAPSGNVTTSFQLVTDKHGYIMVLPFNYKQVYITLSYNIIKDGVTTEYTASATKEVPELEAGKHVNINLTLDIDASLGVPLDLAVTIVDWNKVETDGVIINME